MPSIQEKSGAKGESYAEGAAQAEPLMPPFKAGGPPAGGPPGVGPPIFPRMWGGM
jgi:hypothetical protein